MKTKPKKIIVIGSANVDLCVSAKDFPKPGETVLGNDFMTNTGGKGANQAVAAARLGAHVSFIGCVGNDDFGALILSNLEKDKINTQYVAKSNNAPTGTALIIVNQSGENEIVVVPGANYELSERHINEAAKILSEADLILLQQEIPSDITEYVIRIAKKIKKKIILNLAPAREISVDALWDLYLILLNETETEFITGFKIDNKEDLISVAAQSLIDRGVQNVIITLGSRGCFVHSDHFIGFIDSFPTQAIDTTGAGDTFAGALSAALNNDNIKEAAVFASRAASLSVSKKGAQTSMPYLEQMMD